MKVKKDYNKCYSSSIATDIWENLCDKKASIFNGDVNCLLNATVKKNIFDLIVTSPPYNIGKEYEKIKPLDEYLHHHEKIINKMIPLLKPGGSLCWQTGNNVVKNEIIPLDIEFAAIFKKHPLQLRNRIIWTFGHGLHCKRRFSGRYETILWYTKTENNLPDYKFHLDSVRVPSKYPGKRNFRGPLKGQYSSNPSGKNPEDVWTNIPNVKANHVEKSAHPCQFPVGLIQRLVLALTDTNDYVFDPFAGACTTGVAAVITGRRFLCSEINNYYAKIGKSIIDKALAGKIKYRDHNEPLYDHTKSKLSVRP
jgi:adenine-specific DNA-methyltransferase